MVYSQSSYNASSTRPFSSETVRINVSFERSSHFTHNPCCVRGTWLLLAIEGVSPSLSTLPSDLWETPHRDLLIPEQWFGAISSHLFCSKQLKETICKCEYHLSFIMFSTAGLSLLSSGSHPGSTELMASFKQMVPADQKSPPSKKKKKKNELLAKMFSKGIITCWI